ncbi:MAG TPA: metal ABC transporter permease [Nitrososphaeraceae archaeon]|jgi:manganese/iron transport system permease protein/iron/zinc/copper transport system permease protein|nr:metal ABC transporter permease [Nitrososphaeraceae archaeon]
MDFIFQPFQYEFFNRAIFVSILVGGTCGLLGVYIVLRGMSYIGHGMSHAVFGGAVSSYIIGLNFYIGAAIWGILSALLITQINKRYKIKADAAIGVVTTAGFAIGIFLMSTGQTPIRNFESLLFGNILSVNDLDFIFIIFISIVTITFIFFFQKRLLFTIFDTDTAKVYGVKTDRIDLLFSIVLAIVVIAAMNSIGVTLLAVAIIAPAISARLITNNFFKMLILSSIIGIITAFLGMYCSFYVDSPSGATIVLFGTASFIIAVIYSHIKKSYHMHFHGDKKHSHPHSHAEEHRHEH